ncbi:hypothetical protein ONS95_011061 [Cadophora gregata]|uniref:uncharacterized protein n=1 Tax=Cadophora gregata TaxID=51156 RepID=UPI0026DDC7A3|nr:uncharacterized protein ONS95_011061 [Cadophora gregata]KAK0119622.1 hypothetical protein ONS95_011061 [Cadophora gregata]KAK0120657.1 hypothetical protein ONS96_010860 [Cadophora gregata f. sp. sojae]
MRFKIWRLAAPEPRNIVVGVKYRPALFGEQLNTYASTSWHTTGMSPIPNTLHVNRESRRLTLESYTLVLGTSTLPPSVSSESFGRIYVNWYRDTISPIGMSKLQTNPIPGLFEQARIQNIALNVRELLSPIRELRSDGCLNMHSLFELPNLEEIIFYYSDRPSDVVESTRSFCLEFEYLDENFIVKDLCKMPLSERPSLSYLLAARKTVHKDYDVLVQKRKVRDNLERMGEEVPVELRNKEIDGILERKRPTVKLAYLAVNCRSSH